MKFLKFIFILHCIIFINLESNIVTPQFFKNTTKSDTSNIYDFIQEQLLTQYQKTEEEAPLNDKNKKEVILKEKELNNYDIYSILISNLRHKTQTPAHQTFLQTLKDLEIISGQHTPTNCVLNNIDKTITYPGRIYLSYLLSTPTTKTKTLKKRQSIIHFFNTTDTTSIKNTLNTLQSNLPSYVNFFVPESSYTQKVINSYYFSNSNMLSKYFSGYNTNPWLLEAGQMLNKIKNMGKTVAYPIGMTYLHNYFDKKTTYEYLKEFIYRKYQKLKPKTIVDAESELKSLKKDVEYFEIEKNFKKHTTKEKIENEANQKRITELEAITDKYFQSAEKVVPKEIIEAEQKLLLLKVKLWSAEKETEKEIKKEIKKLESKIDTYIESTEEYKKDRSLSWKQSFQSLLPWGSDKYYEERIEPLKEEIQKEKDEKLKDRILQEYLFGYLYETSDYYKNKKNDLTRPELRKNELEVVDNMFTSLKAGKEKLENQDAEINKFYDYLKKTPYIQNLIEIKTEAPYQYQMTNEVSNRNAIKQFKEAMNYSYQNEDYKTAALLSAYFLGLEGMHTLIPAGLIYSAYASERDNNDITNYLHTKMIHISNIVRSLQSLNDIIIKNPLLSKNLEFASNLHNLFNPESSQYSKKMHNLIALLLTNTFTGNPSYFSLKGKVLAAYMLMNECKEEFTLALQAAGEIDALLSCSDIYLEQKETNNPYSFAQFIESSTPIFNIKDMWNPLLNKQDNKDVITNSINLGPDIRKNVLISGPNAGGKSTFMKGTAIATIMAQSLGIIPAHNLSLTPFHEILTYMNIADDTAKGTSLYKAEVNRITSLVSTLKSTPENKFCFTIIDELFNGTSPEQSSLAGYATADEIGSFKNSIAIIASHFKELKLLEENTPHFNNYKVEVKEHGDGTWNYTFKIVPGASTQNVALDILKDESSLNYQYLQNAQNLFSQKGN